MNNKRWILFFVIGMGLCVHAAAVFLLSNLTIKTHLSKPSAHHLSEIVARQRKTEMLAEIFQHLQEEKPEAKKQFHELKTEYAPSIEIAFDKADLPTLEIKPFTLLPTLSPQETPISLDTSSLIADPPLMVTTANLELEKEDCDLATLARSEHFDVDVEYVPKRSRPGYVFKVTFYPSSDTIFKRIRQNIFFLIDRSNSIPRARYALNKKAVAEALNHLKPGDTFNILIFDNRVIRLASEPLLWNANNVKEAQAFLEKQGHGGYFAATDLYASLGKIIPNNVSDHEVNTAILLSDGDTFLSKEKQRVMIGEWTKRNNGKVSLFCLATGSGNNLALLDLISSFNQGRLLYSQDHNELAPLLVNLIKSIETPIGKSIVTTAVTADKQMSVLLQPTAIKLPDLYQNRPFVVYGSTNRLSDFVLFLQGKYYDHCFDIKKKISLENAKVGSFAIERKWTELLAHEYYARYFEDGNHAHLQAAKQLLSPMNLTTAWLD